MASKQPKLSTEIKKTRRELYLEFVCASAEIKATGCQMEHYFEPESIKKNKATGRTIRSCKYDRYFKGINPSQETIQQIEGKVAGSYALYYSSLWHALNLIRCKDNDYDQFYSTLSLEVLSVIYEPKKNEFNKRQRRPLCHKGIEKLMIIGGLDVLACLIAFRVERDSMFLHTSVRYLDAAIYTLFANCCVHNPLSLISKPLYLFIKQQFTQFNKDLGNSWSNSEEYFVNIISKKEELLSLAISLRLIKYDYIFSPFLYWINIGNEEVIKNEMTRCVTFTDESLIGLRRLITKINPYYPRSERIDI